MVVLDNILNPKRTLDGIKEILLEQYVKDYGEESREELKKRWEKTIFMTDANPIETYLFHQALRRVGKGNTIRFLQAKVEKIDYARKENQLYREFERDFIEYMQNKYQIYNEKQIIDMITMPKKDMEEKGYGVTLIHDVFSRRRDFKESQRKTLLRETRWGKRIQKECPDLTVDQIHDIIFDDAYPATTAGAVDKNGEMRIICFIPIIRHSNINSLDRMVLHELRHVIESDGKGRCGLVQFGTDKYELLNELRTEKNALKDEQNVPLFFARRNQETQSVYEDLLETIPELDTFMDFLNKIAYHGNIEAARSEIDPLDKRVMENSQEWQKRRKERA